MKTLASLKIVVLVGVIVSGLAFTLRPLVAAAGTGQIYVSPSSSSVQNGSDVTVAVRINPGVNVDGVQFTLNFNPALLKFSSVDSASSPFSIQLQQTSTAGSVTVARGLLSSTVSSDSLIANITLHGLADSGTSTLSLTNANATSAGAYTNPAVVNGNVSLAAAPANTPPAGGGTTTSPTSGSTNSGSTTPPTSSTPATTKSSGSGSKTGTSTGGSTSTTPPIVRQSGSSAGVVDSQYTAVGISLETTVPTQVYVKYGIDTALNLQTPLSSLATSHTVSLDPSLLIPGQTYYYQIVVKDTAGHLTMTNVHSFSTKGFAVHFLITDAKGHKMAHTKVELHSIPVTTVTDANGIATFNNVSPGLHHVVYTAGSHQFSEAVTINNAVQTDSATGRQTAPLQTIAVQFATTPSNVPITTGVVLAGAAVLFSAFYLLRSRFRRSPGYGVQAVTAANPLVTTSTSTQNPKQDGTPLSIETAHGVSNPNPGSVVAPVEHHVEDKEA